MTSRGHVTIPAAAPATAPQKLLTEELGIFAANIAIREGVPGFAAEGFEASWEDEVAACIPYRCCFVDMVAEPSKDIMRLALILIPRS